MNPSFFFAWQEIRLECYNQSMVATGKPPQAVNPSLNPSAVIPPLFMPVRDDNAEEPSLAITMLDVWCVYFVPRFLLSVCFPVPLESNKSEPAVGIEDPRFPLHSFLMLLHIMIHCFARSDQSPLRQIQYARTWTYRRKRKR